MYNFRIILSQGRWPVHAPTSHMADVISTTQGCFEHHYLNTTYHMRREVGKNKVIVESNLNEKSKTAGKELLFDLESSGTRHEFYISAYPFYS